MRVVGVDECRVRDMREFQVVRFSHLERPTVVLALAEGEHLRTITITNPRPGRRCGFAGKDDCPNFLEILKLWGLRPAELVKAAGGAPGPTDRADLPAQQEFSLSFFPRRGQAAIGTMLARDPGKARAWVSALLRAYLLLRLDRYDEAKALLAGARLEDYAGVDPFLQGLGRFYGRLCERPPTATTVPLDFYQVTPAYFALCYPYPTFFRRDSTPFAFDPEFQDRYHKSMAWSEAEHRAAVAAGGNYQVRGQLSGTPAEEYVGQVQAALLNARDHGGWPYRSDIIWEAENRPPIIRALRERLAAKPDETVLTAFALLCPAVLANDAAAFRQAYDLVAASGPNEIGQANRMLGSMARFWHQAGLPDEMETARAAANRALALPPIYAYLRRFCPEYEALYRVGMVVSWNEELELGPDTICGNEPYLVQMALANPVDLGPTDELTQQALAGRDLQTARQTLKLLAWRLGAPQSQPQACRQFLAVAEQCPTGEVFDAVRQVAWRHAALAKPASFEAGTFPGFFHSIDLRNYADSWGQVQALANADPGLVEKIDRLYAKAGTPCATMLLVAKLVKAGHTAEAQAYRRRVTDYYACLASAYFADAGQPAEAAAILLDLTTIPGFATEATPFAARANGTDTPALLPALAILAAERGEMDAAVDLLLEALRRPPVPLPGRQTTWYAGQPVPLSGDALPTLIAHDWFMRGLLTGAAQEKLAREPRLRRSAFQNVDQTPIRAGFATLSAVPAPGPVVIDGKLADWDLSGQALACADAFGEMDTHSARVAAMYDQDGLLLAVTWKDAEPLSNKTSPRDHPADGANGDCLQVALAIGERRCGLDCWYYGPTAEAAVYYRPADGQARLLAGHGPDLGDGLAIAFTADADNRGYVQELRIPWALVAATPPPAGSDVGLHLRLVWGAETPEQALPACYRAEAPNPGAVAQTPADYGRLRLEPAGNLNVAPPAWQVELERRVGLDRRFDRHTGAVRALAFSPDGKFLVSGSLDQTVRLWDLAKGREAQVLTGHEGGVSAVAVTPDSKTIASGGDDRSIRLWDVASGRQTHVLAGHDKGVAALAFSHDGRRLASASFDGTARLWDVATDREVSRFTVGQALRTVCFSPDGTLLLAGGQNQKLYLWSLADGKPARELLGHRYAVRSAQFSPDGKQVVSGSDDMTLRIWDTATGATTFELKGHASMVTGVGYFDGGKRVLSAGLDGTVRVWDAAAGTAVSTFGEGTAGVVTMAILPDAGLLALANRDNSIRVKGLPKVNR